MLLFPTSQTKLELLSWASTIMSQKTKKDLVSCRRTVHRGLLRGENLLRAKDSWVLRIDWNVQSLGVEVYGQRSY